MAKPISIASILFTRPDLNGQAAARQRILDDLRGTSDLLAGREVDLVVFSEAISALAQSVDQAEERDSPGPLLQAYGQLALDQKCTVAGSVKLAENGRVYNSIVYIGPDGGILGAYHKTFPTMEELAEGLSHGHGATVVQTPAGRLGGVICFDLNFPELWQAYAPLRPDILTFSSMYHGGAVVQGYWAYQCQSYFASALPFHGGGVLDVFGRPLAATDCYSSVAIATVNLDRALVHLDGNAPRFPDIRRKYGSRIRLEIPPNVGSALMTSLDDRLTAMQVVREFDLELLDDYFARARRARPGV